MLTQNDLEGERYQTRLNAERDRMMYFNDAREDGLERGRQKGFAQGFAEGFAQGFAEGLAKGLIIGRMQVCQQMLQMPVQSPQALVRFSLAQLEAENAALQDRLGIDQPCIAQIGRS
jgi:flagellar biosynthesis/type III secretory pathway protein FliH